MWLFQRDRRRHPGRPAKGVRRFEAGLEEMEGRRVLNGSGATIALVGSTIEVIGTNLGDTGSVTMQNGMVEVKMSNSQGSDDDLFPASGVVAIEYIGGSGNNTFANDTPLTGLLFGGSGNNVLTGGSGFDYLFAEGSGTNVLNAGSGTEMIEALGGNNTLNAGTGNTTIFAFAGDNHVVGGSGTMSVITLGGQNVIDGGTGASTVFSFVSTDEIHQNAEMTVYYL